MQASLCSAGVRHALGFLVMHAIALFVRSSPCLRLDSGSIPLCGRCVHDDLCQDGYTCDAVRQKCVNETWSTSLRDQICWEDPTNPSTWGARCEQACTDQAAPFSCATNCLNEDFPCRWTTSCIGAELTGMDMTQGACMRPCQDHPEWLFAQFSLNTCEDVIERFGCGDASGVSKYCPISCGSIECPTRCSDPVYGDEPGGDGKRCFDRVFTDGISCLDAVLEGRDCHCACSNIYTDALPNDAGAFGSQTYYHGLPLEQTIVAAAGNAFTVSVTGISLSTYGVRIAFIDSAGVCASTATASCGSGDLWDCLTVPTAYTPWVHRWSEVVIGECARMKLCHCNGDCGHASSWHQVGTVDVQPYQHPDGMVGRPMPGCESYYGMPSSIAHVIGEEYADKKIVATIDISGGLLWNAETRDAIQGAMQQYLRAHSQLLGREVPSSGDIEIISDIRRRLEEWWPLRRRLQELAERIDPFALRVHVKVRSYTTGTADLFTERLLALGTDATAFLTYLHMELGESGISEGMLPDFMSVFLSREPFETIIYSEEPEEDNSTMVLVVILAVFAFAITCCCVLCLCKLLMVSRARVAPEDIDEGEAEEGSWRASWRKSRNKEAAGMYTVQEEGDDGEGSEGGARSLCGKCPCLRRRGGAGAEAWSEPAQESRIKPGMAVTLVNMSKRRFDGQLAKVISGPDRKGKFTVEITRKAEDDSVKHETVAVQEHCLEPLQYRFAGGSYRAR